MTRRFLMFLPPQGFVAMHGAGWAQVGGWALRGTTRETADALDQLLFNDAQEKADMVEGGFASPQQAQSVAAPGPSFG